MAGPAEAIELLLSGRARDLGDGVHVRRVLPSVQRRMVGPFIFLDHLGPVALPVGRGLDVRPHPHINLATVTYLFEGEFLHRDSLGSAQPIRPGAVNWMTAGRGIVHSERSPEGARQEGVRLHGAQLWVALPKAFEEVAPSFQHHPADTLPVFAQESAELTLIAGNLFGRQAPVELLSPLFLADARLPTGAKLALPTEPEQRAAYVVSGRIGIGDRQVVEGELAIFRPGETVALTAVDQARVLLLGGAALDGERHLFWNFVSSSPQRLEQAKADWRDGRFPKVPGDELEFIPLPARVQS